MELQWPLIIFTTFIAWSAGVFGMQGLLAARGTAFKAQMPTLITAFVIMVVGGIAVFFHLEHWERIFNGFGHITSGITQELIGIIVMVVVMVVYFAQLRQRNDGTVAKWCGVLAVVIAVVLVVAMGHSYMMDSRPAWNSVVQVLSLLGASCVLGPATVAACMACCGDDPAALSPFVLIGSVVNAITGLGFMLVMGSAQDFYASLGYWYDPTQIARGMIDFEAATGIMHESRMGLVVLTAILMLVPVVLAALCRIKGAEGASGLGRWKALSIAIVVVAAASAVALRVLFYGMGAAMYMFY